MSRMTLRFGIVVNRRRSMNMSIAPNLPRVGGTIHPACSRHVTIQAAGATYSASSDARRSTQHTYALIPTTCSTVDTPLCSEL